MFNDVAMSVLKSLSDYKPLWIQHESDSIARNTLTEWGLIVKSVPFMALPDAKEPYKNSWHDEDGDDEYNDVMYYDAYTVDVQFLISADTAEEVVSALRSFFEYVRNGQMKMYDEHTCIGRQKVRYASFADNAYRFREGGVHYLEATITFKVNDPVTFIEKIGDILDVKA